ncbi:MAG: fumarylacetoacetate hydrolase family protein [Defluviicoccus sp.]|nr:fumarylacetoacetate hydrolase family protein [Defluviicoccus sp.]MDE0384775.1 fumarylacetoacetate hydrolase family protein [Defluviicoccus sp.]
MRLVTFKKGRGSAIGVRTDEGIVDLSVADESLPQDMIGLLAGGDRALARAARAAGKPPEGSIKRRVNYLPPVPNPGKVICVGLNYSDHAAEAGMKPPEYPVLFLRTPASLVGHGQPILRPKASKHHDYEAELVAVIGKPGRRIAKARALDHVAGYSVANEGSIRDYQMKTSQWMIGKSFDASGSFGPEIVTPDELPNKGAKGLKIEARLNGETLQSSTTSSMIFDVATLVNECSKIFSLESGDIIVTGTPAGVGFVRKPPIFMKPGDTCEIEIEGVGVLSNPIAAEK